MMQAKRPMRAAQQTQMFLFGATDQTVDWLIKIDRVCSICTLHTSTCTCTCAHLFPPDIRLFSSPFPDHPLDSVNTGNIHSMIDHFERMLLMVKYTYFCQNNRGNQCTGSAWSERILLCTSGIGDLPPTGDFMFSPDSRVRAIGHFNRINKDEAKKKKHKKSARIGWLSNLDLLFFCRIYRILLTFFLLFSPYHLHHKYLIWSSEEIYPWGLK